jgi:hypothetical protein
MEGVPPYAYPEIQWLLPEEIVADDPRITYERVVHAGSRIPLMRYIVSIGWTLQMITDRSREWFDRFCFLLDNMRKPNQDSMDNSFLRLRK